MLCPAGGLPYLGQTFGHAEFSSVPSDFDDQRRRNSACFASNIAVENERRRQRVKVFGKPNTTVKFIVAAVGTFERWLWTRPGETRRPIYEIPPEELDPLLVEFFTTVKKPSGENYHHESFISLRSRLDSYLRDNEYPFSITHSEMFACSQQAFKNKRLELKEIAKANTHNTIIDQDTDLSGGTRGQFIT